MLNYISAVESLHRLALTLHWSPIQVDIGGNARNGQPAVPHKLHACYIYLFKFPLRAGLKRLEPSLVYYLL
jgi:hypothetical protein